ncbi:MAG: hypothetical protein WKF52_03205 [Sphingomicrobium sp.]
MSSAHQPPLAAAELVSDARWLVQALDLATDMVRVIEMDSEAYRSASFLDDRILQQPHFAEIVPWASIADAVPVDARSDARWIFHIGHVGSTLVARLLGEIDGVLSVREPRVLRDVAMLPAERRRDYAAPLGKLLSRTFAPDEVALVKATSFVSEIADELVPQGQRALFMYSAPRAYIASILAGENSVKELAALGPSRAQRMSGRVPGLGGSSEAHAAAAAWACEMTALESAADKMHDRTIAWADFDTMVADMPNDLMKAAQTFGFAAPADRIHLIATGPLMRRYSKAVEFDYSPSLRRKLIAEAEREHRADIDSALAMLQSAAGQSPLLARALERAQPES